MSSTLAFSNPRVAKSSNPAASIASRFPRPKSITAAFPALFCDFSRTPKPRGQAEHSRAHQVPDPAGYSRTPGVEQNLHSTSDPPEYRLELGFSVARSNVTASLDTRRRLAKHALEVIRGRDRGERLFDRGRSCHRQSAGLSS